jgi:alpha-mannosidase
MSSNECELNVSKLNPSICPDFLNIKQFLDVSRPNKLYYVKEIGAQRQPIISFLLLTFKGLLINKYEGRSHSAGYIMAAGMKNPGIIIIFSLFIPLFGGVSMGRTTRLAATIEVTASQLDQLVEHKEYLNGYYKSVSGQTIAYHSSHPDAEDALLVRARRDIQSIVWKTDTLPTSYTGDFYNFIWLAGIDLKGWGGTTPHEFKMYINNELYFVFTNRKDETAFHWTLVGKDNSELTFDSQLTDKYGDLFGYMYLRVPKSKFSPGSPLEIRVDGQDADSPEWYMTFKYSFNFKPDCRLEPVLVRDDGKIKQELRISFDNLIRGRMVKISVTGQEPISRPLDIGGNIFRILIPSVKNEAPMDIKFINDKNIIERSSIVIVPPVKRNIYLIPYSHNDIGYTDLQTYVEQKQWTHLDEALRLIADAKDYPYESRFKWNLEILWPLESYLKQASPEKKQQLLNAIHDGNIGLNALYINPLTGLANSTEMAHFLDYAREFSGKYSIPIRAATISDIPGFTWGIVTVLAQNGVKYFASGPNSGDRIGFVIDKWGDKPFYWKSQSGQEKVLFWVAGSSYSSFHQGTLTGAGPDKIMKLARKLNDSKYPYDIYFLPYTLGDNGGPDSTLAPTVKVWNEKYITPTLIISTQERMFEDFEKKYGAGLPSYSGDFTPYWEDGALSTAFETAMTRRSVDKVIQAEALYSIRFPEKYPKRNFDKTWRDIVLWDEHTWGADISVSDPDNPKTTGQWNIKRQFATDADRQSAELLASALCSTRTTTHDEIALDVYNTCSWQRSDIVILDLLHSEVGDCVQNERGEELLSQRLSTGELAVFIENMPPLAPMRIYVKSGDHSLNGDVHLIGNTIENSRLALTVDENTGAISSLVDKSTGIEFADINQPYINRYIYVPGTNPDSAQYLSNIKISVKEKGSLTSSLLITADAPGCDSYSSEIRIIHNICRVDIINTLNKRAIRTKEGVHFAFPFKIPDAKLHYDVASGIVQPEMDQIDGSCKNFYSITSWCDISNESSGITWTTIDAPLIEIGSITAEFPWMKKNPPSSCFYSYVMNNYWHTNYKADQAGIVQFRYSLYPGNGFSSLGSSRLGREQRQPLLVSFAEKSQSTYPFLFEFNLGNIIVESIKPIDNGLSLLLHLYNPQGKTNEFQIECKDKGKAQLFSSDLSGKKVKAIKGALEIPGYGARFVRVDKQ